MSTVQELVDAGDLQGALHQLSGEVKARPADDRGRTLLFELLSFAGEWERAERQLDVLAEQSTQVEVGTQVYRNIIKAERARSRLFSDGLIPTFLFDPPDYIALYLEAINRIREGNFTDARELLDQAEEQRASCSGILNGSQFLDIRDYNDVTGGVLELIVRDQYFWVPIEQIKSLNVEKPKRLRDLLWASAHIETIDGTVGEAFVPALYNGSNKHPDQQVKLGRMTDWQEVSDGLYLGAGLRLFLVDDRDRSLFDLKSVQFGNIEFTAGPLPM